MNLAYVPGKLFVAYMMMIILKLTSAFDDRANISMFLASLRPGFVKGDDRFEDKAYFDEYLAECGEECKEFQTCFVTYRISAQKPDTTTRN